MIRFISAFMAAFLLAGAAYADSEGAVIPGNRATRSTLTGCTYIAAGVTLADGQQVATQCGANGSALVSGTVTATTGLVAVTPTDKGGTITLGGTAQTLAASNTSRKSLTIQNPCTATGQGIAAIEDLYISVTGSATIAGASNFADLPACASVEVSFNGTVITAAVTVNAASTNHRWSATESQ